MQARTFHGRYDDHPVMVELARLHGHARLVLHDKLCKGRIWSAGKGVKDNLCSTLPQEVGLPANVLGHVYADLAATHAARPESLAQEAEMLSRKAAAKQKDIDKNERLHVKTYKRRDKAIADIVSLTKKLHALPSRKVPTEQLVQRRIATREKLTKARKTLKAARADIKRLRLILHQGKRRLGVLNDRTAHVIKEQAKAVPSMVMGGRDLFAEQSLAQNKVEHAAWKAEWQRQRHAQVYHVGTSGVPSGNMFVRAVALPNGRFDIEVRLPPVLHHLAEQQYSAKGHNCASITLRSVAFPHGAEFLRAALVARTPVTWRFQHDLSKKKPTWRVFFTIVDKAEAPSFFDRPLGQGCLGVDVNAGHIAVTQVDAQGRFVRTWRFSLPGGGKHGRTSDQVADDVRQVANLIIRLARSLNLPIAAESLDFSRKKADLRAAHGPKYARMLHSLAYSSFGKALDRASERAGIPLRRVNPAFTSFIARVTYARPLGLSVHAAAAMSVARRAMDLSEYLPTPVGGMYRIPDDSGVLVAVPAPVASQRDAGEAVTHVWTLWGMLGRGYKAALKARAVIRPLGSVRRSALGPWSRRGDAAYGGKPRGGPKWHQDMRACPGRCESNVGPSAPQGDFALRP